jgi:L-2-hydroxyglutarate oxidase LhgO
MESANIVVIGGGVVGLAVAARLSMTHKDVYVLEKNHKIGQEISSHNSGVIHSGIHYPPGSLKASLCIQGNKMIYDICKKNQISFKRLGKLTVATDESQVKILDQLFTNGEGNNVPGLSLMDSGQIKRMEPNVNAIEALYTPTSGIIEQDELIQYFASLTTRNGGIISTQTEVAGIRYDGSVYKLSGKSVGKTFTFDCETVINCAGLYSDKVAEMVGLDIDKLGYRLSYYKGDYFRVLGPPPVRTLVYPVPQGAGLGIHATPDMSGSVKLGPNAYSVSSIDYGPASNGEDFLEDVSKFIPGIRKSKIEFDSSGIRPKLSGSDKQFKDFVIRNEEKHGYPGFINLIGIESPGLTASPAIAEYVSGIYESEVK